MNRDTVPLPWTGAKRTAEEIQQQRVKQNKWLEARKKESLERVRIKSRNGYAIGFRNEKTDIDTIRRLLVGTYYIS